jgi:hypothetical protein
MKFYIREWNDQTVTLMTENGNVLGYFPSISDALTACDEWYMYNNNEPRHEVKVHAHNLVQQTDTFAPQAA